MNFKDFFSVFLILFSIIDIFGSLPIIINMQKKGIKIDSIKVTVAAAFLMIIFLFLGESVLKLFGISVGSFAIAGGIVLFIIGLEMILGITLMKEESNISSSSIVPIAFPLVAGAGTLTTILSLKAEFETINIILGIIANLIVVFIVLKFSKILQKVIGNQGAEIIRRMFGIILLSIAIKLIASNWVKI